MGSNELSFLLQLAPLPITAFAFATAVTTVFVLWQCRGIVIDKTQVAVQALFKIQRTTMMNWGLVSLLVATSLSSGYPIITTLYNGIGTVLADDAINPLVEQPLDIDSTAEIEINTSTPTPEATASVVPYEGVGISPSQVIDPTNVDVAIVNTQVPPTSTEATYGGWNELIGENDVNNDANDPDNGATCIVRVREDLSANVNIRASYNTQSTVLAVVERGEMLANVSNAAEFNDGSSWYQVTTIDGTVGWVYGNLISMEGCDAPRALNLTVEPSTATPTTVPVQPTTVPGDPQPTSIPAQTVTPEPSTEPTETQNRPVVQIRSPYNAQVIISVSDTTFEAVAFDPDYGTDNGANIDRVEFIIYDANGTRIYQRMEHHTRYCVGTGDEQCGLVEFLMNRPGAYTITAQAWDRDGQASDIASHTFVISVPAPTPEPTTVTPVPTVEPTATITEPPAVIDPEPTETQTPGEGNNPGNNDDNNNAVGSDDNNDD